jgi:c-di-AMP phosphodiesterase-like protein
MSDIQSVKSENNEETIENNINESNNPLRYEQKQDVIYNRSTRDELIKDIIRREEIEKLIKKLRHDVKRELVDNYDDVINILKSNNQHNNKSVTNIVQNKQQKKLTRDELLRLYGL